MKKTKLYLITLLTISISLAATAQNKAIQFDGTNNHINIAKTNTLIESNPDYTIEFWVRSDDASCDMIYCEGINSNNDMIRIFGSGGKLHFRSYIGNANTQISSTGNNLFKEGGEWNHIAYVGKDDNGTTNLTLYINGVENNTGSYTRSTEDWDRYTIGALTRTSNQGSESYNFNGELDEFRMWSRALEASEITTNMCVTTNTTGLVHYIRFNEGSGTTVSDEVDTNVNHTVSGTPVWVDKSDCDTVTGLEKEVSVNEFSVYPNPTQNTLRIQSTRSIARVTLRNLSGQEVHSSSNTSAIDVSQLSQGMYFISLSCTDGHMHTQKVMIK